LAAYNNTAKVYGIFSVAYSIRLGIAIAAGEYSG